jgi:hypothetical protein
MAVVEFPRVPVKTLQWSPKFSFEKFDKCKAEKFIEL